MSRVKREPNLGRRLSLNELEAMRYRTWIWSMTEIKAASDCWEWQGASDAKGYGRMWCGTHGAIRSHRVAYAAFNGPVTRGAIVRHSCDNTRCTNPAHLLTGSMKENAKDREERGRHGGPTRKLDGAAYRSLRLISDLGYSQSQLASMFNVSQTTVGRYLRNGPIQPTL